MRTPVLRGRFKKILEKKITKGTIQLKVVA
jgi:hypothetical protein